MYLTRRVRLFNSKKESKIFEFRTQAEEDAINNGVIWHEDPNYWNKKVDSKLDNKDTEPEVKFTDYRPKVGRPRKETK